MKRGKYFTLKLVTLGLVFHLWYLISIFDIYFRTPVIHGMQPVPIENVTAPAQRLVLFVADGLRADKFFELKHEAPFLRRIIEKEGSWGISHTRVPTESRPGHVAMIAGMYEDVSAVTTGWKDNPVEFDSVFNRSRWTWSWGSPDIVPMFSKHTENVFADAYPPEFEDFASDAWLLDKWVFDKFEKFLNTPDPRMHEDKVYMFLHLLGTDTHGHAKRPYSEEYLNNIRKIDRAIENAVNHVESLFNHDGKTAYIFTADHGMSDRGNHGDGERANTETPLVVWGAGVSKPVVVDKPTVFHQDRVVPNHERPTPAEWGLSNLARLDVEQGDVAPLMASLLGVSYPVNNVGVLPALYIDKSQLKLRVSALYTNAEQIFRQMARKSEMKRETTLFFTEFPRMTLAKEKLNELRQRAIRLHAEANPTVAAFEDYEDFAKEAIDVSLDGMHYFQVYDWPFLMTVITLGYVGWIFFVAVIIVQYFSSNSEAPELQGKISPIRYWFIGIFSVLLFAFLLHDQSPLSYFVYAIFPIGFWGYIITSGMPVVRYAIQYVKKGGSQARWDIITVMGGCLAAAQILVLAFYRRETISIIFAVQAFWGLFKWGGIQLSLRLRLIWAFVTMALSIFPIVPISMGESYVLVCGGGILLIFMGFMAFKYVPDILVTDAALQQKSKSGVVGAGSAVPEKKLSITSIIFLVYCTTAVILVFLTDRSLERNAGLPFVNQLLSWTILVTGCLLVVANSDKTASSLIANLFVGVGGPYILMSVSFETLFLCVFTLFLFVWLFVERGLADAEEVADRLIAGASTHVPPPVDKKYDDMSLRHARIAAIYVALCLLAFFGTGNVASVASFEIASTYRFVTVFNPFLMAALLLVKLMIPFALLAAFFGLLSRVLRLPPLALSLLVTAIADVMTINFFFLVKDSGSWLEIGMSISYFVMANAFLVFHFLMSGLSAFLLRRVQQPKLKNE